MNYITLDFETANSNLTSPCSVGLVEVNNNEIYKEEHFLIDPEELFFDFNANLHGISELDVIDAPTITEVWPFLFSRLHSKVVVCHNANFDIGIIKACAKKFSLPMPNMKVVCTVRVARKLWPELPNHRLDTIAEFLKMDLNHHNALSDARVCYRIIDWGIRNRNVSDIKGLLAGLELRFL